MTRRISRATAKAKGRRYFFTGEPCSQGHIAPRYVRDGRCVECNRTRCRAHHWTYRDHRNSLRRAGHSRNRDYENTLRRMLHSRRRDWENFKRRRHYDANQEHEKAMARIYHRMNRATILAKQKARRAEKKEAIEHAVGVARYHTSPSKRTRKQNELLEARTQAERAEVLGITGFTDSRAKKRDAKQQALYVALHTNPSKRNFAQQDLVAEAEWKAMIAATRARIRDIRHLRR
ncbi:MAG TPA: hypothetical protein VGU20_01150 [Stellaceae bacterium]|nr:hypothetical protein [Stellaceae bacterium]